jgi:DNA-directed RNA polymerase subunit N (RpoN/RPB10)
MNYCIPMRCVCNRPLAGKWLPYLEMVKRYRKAEGRPENGDLVYVNRSTIVTAEGRAMDELELTQECCRVRFLAHPGM